MDRLRPLAEQVDIVGDLRGRGGVLAIELVKPGGKEPNPEATKAIAAQCQSEGVIILTCGTYGNVVRLLPPLVTGGELLDDALDVLEAADAERASGVKVLKRSACGGALGASEVSHRRDTFLADLLGQRLDGDRAQGAAPLRLGVHHRAVDATWPLFTDGLGVLGEDAAAAHALTYEQGCVALDSGDDVEQGDLVGGLGEDKSAALPGRGTDDARPYEELELFA